MPLWPWKPGVADRGMKGISGNLYIMLLLGKTSEHVHSRRLYILSNNQESCYPGGVKSEPGQAGCKLSQNSFHSAVRIPSGPVVLAAR